MHGKDENPGFERECSFVAGDRDGPQDNTGKAEPTAVLAQNCDLMEGGLGI